jgi:hypothetical protein
MISPVRPITRHWPALVFAALCWTGPALHAQTGPEVLPTDGTDSLKEEYRTYRTTLSGLFRGDIAVRSKDDEDRFAKAIDFEARWVTYRLTWHEFEREPGKIDRLFRDFENDLANLQRYKQDTPFVARTFTECVAIHAKEVMATRKPIARVNAARMMERLPELGVAQNELAEVFIEVVKDTQQNDGVRLFALRGLRNLLAYPQPKPPMQPILAKDREEKVILALIEFVERKVNFAPTAPREEVEGYRSLRREAFRALAWAKTPSIGDKARPGLVLLRALALDGFTPDLRLDEQVEAAVGVTRLQPQLDKTYQPDYAAYVLGQFIAAMGEAYQTRSDDKEHLRGFKIYAARLIEGLNDMKPGPKMKTPPDDYLRAVIAQAAQMLAKIETGGTAAPIDLSRWLEANPSPSNQLYNGLPESTVKPALSRPAS